MAKVQRSQRVRRQPSCRTPPQRPRPPRVRRQLSCRTPTVGFCVPYRGTRRGVCENFNRCRCRCRRSCSGRLGTRARRGQLREYAQGPRFWGLGKTQAPAPLDHAIYRRIRPATLRGAVRKDIVYLLYRSCCGKMFKSASPLKRPHQRPRIHTHTHVTSLVPSSIRNTNRRERGVG